ncbi:MAG: coenzyme F420-0:L-glutamate ligase [bacterium]
MELSINPGKNLTIEVEGEKYSRYALRTHFIEPGEKIEGIVEKYCLPVVQKGDVVVLGQKIISLAQGRVIKKEEVRLGFWAKFLSQFAHKTPAGFSVGNPYKMQVAINLAGLPRIIFAAGCAAFLKIFGIRGIFYRLAGNQINQLDGFYGEAYPQYSQIGVLGPENCDDLCEKLKNKYGFSFIVADVNDLGGNILGTSNDLKSGKKLFKAILKDNPAGQTTEQTPIIIIRNPDA